VNTLVFVPGSKLAIGSARGIVLQIVFSHFVGDLAEDLHPVCGFSCVFAGNEWSLS